MQICIIKVQSSRPHHNDIVDKTVMIVQDNANQKKNFQLEAGYGRSKKKEPEYRLLKKNFLDVLSFKSSVWKIFQLIKKPLSQVMKGKWKTQKILSG